MVFNCDKNDLSLLRSINSSGILGKISGTFAKELKVGSCGSPFVVLFLVFFFVDIYLLYYKF